MEGKSHVERASAYLRLCKFFTASGNYDKAAAIYENCIQMFSNDFRIYFNYGQLCCLRECYAQALMLFYDAEKRTVDNIIIFHALSGVLIKLRDPANAVFYCRKALESNSSDCISWYNLNVSLRQLNQMDQAIVESRCQIKKNIAINGFRSLPPTILQLSTVEGLVKSSEIADSNEHEVGDDVFSNLRGTESGHRAHRTNHAYGHDRAKLVYICLKFGTKYGPEYVNNLHNALKRERERLLADQEQSPHAVTKSRGTLDDFRFVCYTDDPSGLCDGVEVQLLPMKRSDSADLEPEIEPGPHEDSHSYSGPQGLQSKSRSRAHDFSSQQLALQMADWQGWWYKAYLFHAVTLLETCSRNGRDRCSVQVDAEQRVGAEKGTTDNQRISQHELRAEERPWMCFMDLDTVICGSLDFLYHLSASNNRQSAESSAAASDSPTQKQTGQSMSRPVLGADEFEEEGKDEEEKEEILYTLGAAHFPSEGRLCGLNSSIMLWQPRGRNITYVRDVQESDPRSCAYEEHGEVIREGLEVEGESATSERSSSLEFLFIFLLANYVSVNQCVYKFDHYLELMLLPPQHVPIPSAQKDVSCGLPVKVVYLQELHGIGGRVVDFCSLTHRSHPMRHAEGQDSQPRDYPSEETSLSALDGDRDIDGANLQGRRVSLDEKALFAASIICFPLSPKPHTAANSFPIIRTLWEASGP